MIWTIRGAEISWQVLGLPQPNWITVNPASGFAHYVYGLKAPVLLNGKNVREKPIRYLEAVKRAFTNKLNADESYVGLITKNPFHSGWNVIPGPDTFYDLSDLAEFVDITGNSYPLRKLNEEPGNGRNVTLFNSLRFWVYKNIKNHREENSSGGCSRSIWGKKCSDYALNLNMKFDTPLSEREVHQIVKSVSKWTYDRFNNTWNEVEFKQKQSIRGALGGIRSGEVRSQKRKVKYEAIKKMLEQGIKKKNIAIKLGVHPNTITNILKNMFKPKTNCLKPKQAPKPNKKSQRSHNQIIPLKEGKPNELSGSVMVEINGFTFERVGNDCLLYDGKPIGYYKWGFPPLLAAFGIHYRSLEDWEVWYELRVRKLKADNAKLNL